MGRGCRQIRSVIHRTATGSRPAAWSLLGAVSALVLAAPDAAAGSCTNTAVVAFRACFADALDNFLIAKGVCLNLGSAAEFNDCLAEARSTRREERTLCRDQRSARGELCQALGEDAYDPDFDPANFVDPRKIGHGVTPNPYFPLVAGYQWVYESDEQTITVAVTKRTKLIEGVTCVVVTDRVEEGGVVVEDTEDWHAQDTDGNVWYCGELSKTLEVFEGDRPPRPELVELEGSWKTGREGDKPGIIMLAKPQVGDVYRQEFALSTAEDAAEVISTTGSESTPAASCDGDCLVTRDFSPLEPDVEENKYYAPGVGPFLEVEDGIRTELVEFKTTP
jgi:hypothetical protein